MLSILLRLCEDFGNTEQGSVPSFFESDLSALDEKSLNLAGCFSDFSECATYFFLFSSFPHSPASPKIVIVMLLSWHKQGSGSFYS